MYIRIWILILLCMGMLTGCSFPGEETEGSVQKDTLGLTPDFSYEVKVQTPNILVNQVGYFPDSGKIALLQGQDLESAYQVYQVGMEEPVLEGELTPAGENLYLADFSSLQEEGSYYLYQKELGYSDPFWVKEAVYDELEIHLLGLLEAETANTSELCYQLAGLLFTLELYPDQILEPDRLQSILENKIASLAKAQDEESGSVYREVSGEGEISLAATAEFAGVMAMYAKYVQPWDWTLAAQHQNMAQKAYNTIRESLDNVSFDSGYFACAHLFRLTGRSSYSQTVVQYLAMEESQKSYTEHDFSLFADYGYLSGKTGINLEWSRQLMNRVREQAAEVSKNANRSTFYVSSLREHYETNQMLRDTAVLTLINYIITNHEYTTLQKDYLDYFLGRNPAAVCLAEGFGTRNGTEEGMERINGQNAALLYLLLQTVK